MLVACLTRGRCGAPWRDEARCQDAGRPKTPRELPVEKAVSSCKVRSLVAMLRWEPCEHMFDSGSSME